MAIITNSNTQNISFSNQQLLTKVFGWMGIGLAITSFVSYEFYSTPSLLSLLITDNQLTGLGYLTMFLPIVFVLIMSFGFNKLSFFSLAVLFILYSSIMGASLSFIFLIYTDESIYSTFIIAALMFGSMALMGYFTKKDLSNMGSILMMGLIGIIIASLINAFMRSDSLSFVISIISVILFCSLTAWDIQKIKNIAADSNSSSETRSKFGIIGALTLYLDFINLFLSLLRIFGNRRKD